MIEVVKERRNDINRKIICTNCGSELQFKISDLLQNNYDYDDRYDYLICPVCNHKLEVRTYNYSIGIHDYILSFDFSNPAEEIN